MEVSDRRIRQASLYFERSLQNHVPSPDEPSVSKLEVGQAIVPRPESEVADVCGRNQTWKVSASFPSNTTPASARTTGIESGRVA